MNNNSCPFTNHQDKFHKAHYLRILTISVGALTSRHFIGLSCKTAQPRLMNLAAAKPRQPPKIFTLDP